MLRIRIISVFPDPENDTDPADPDPQHCPAASYRVRCEGCPRVDPHTTGSAVCYPIPMSCPMSSFLCENCEKLARELGQRVFIKDDLALNFKNPGADPAGVQFSVAPYSGISFHRIFIHKLSNIYVNQV